MGAANKVIAGDYSGLLVLKTVLKGGLDAVILKEGIFSKPIILDKSNVEAYELITEEHTKSAVSGVVRGAVGGALLGGVGLLAGALSANNKGAYSIAVKFKDGKNSLIEVDEKIYKTLIKVLF